MSGVEIFFELLEVLGCQFVGYIDLPKKSLNMVKQWRQGKLYGLKQRHWNNINHRTNVADVG